MKLEEPKNLEELDPQDMLAEIESLPAQLEGAWKMGLGMEPILDESVAPARVLICGMGGSAIGADLAAAWLAAACPAPVVVQRDYGLPGWAQGPDTLVIASSHSGNTEETLDSFDVALKNNCRLMAVCTGGELEQRARRAGVPVWKFAHQGQPRAAVGFSFGLLMAALSRVGLAPAPDKLTAELVAATAAMRAQQEILGEGVPVAHNPAKRLAGQLVGRWVVIYGSGVLAPVARRWKGQMNELAKAGAGFELLPEADHNTLAGSRNPPEAGMRTFHIFLRAGCDHPRNRLRSELTRQALLLEGHGTDAYEAQGDTTLAQMWTALHFGDYLGYYLALRYGVDPTPVEALEELKKALKAAR